MKAIELVHKAIDLGGRLSSARSRGLLRGDAIFVRVVRVTTALTRRVAEVPPKARPTGTERAALTLAAAQLRHLGKTLTPNGTIDHETPEGALAELVIETLGLVDVVLGQEPELGRDEAPALTRGADIRVVAPSD